VDAKLKYRAKKIKIVFFILTGIASGRTPYGIVPEIKALQPDYFAMINGSYVENAKGQVVYHQPMSSELVKSVIDWTKEVGIEYGLLGSKKGTLSARTNRISQVIDLIYDGLETDPEFYKGNDIYQMLTFENDGQKVELPAQLQEDLRTVRWDAISSDIVLKDSSKAAGVAKIVEKLGLKPENVLVFGDELNDIELFEYAGIAIAMGHSHPELQKRADYITKKVEEDGIFDALEKLGMVEKEKKYPQLDVVKAEGPVAHIKTNHGVLNVKLFAEIAPRTVANFVALSKDGYYDGIIFHRIIKDFMIQGGDPTGTGMGGESIYGGSFEDEFSMEAFNLRGALSMANAGPNTNGSQFFIVQNQNFPYNAKELERGGWPKQIAEAYVDNGGTPHLDQRHTVFGHLMDTASFDVLDTIAAVATDSADRPHEDVVIETIEIED
jgi:peptidyl-prolyl cis-trans isomerase B (cyclophilin B)